MRLYLPIEGTDKQQHSLAQIDSAKANGATLGGYVWAYGDVDPLSTVDDALHLAGSNLPPVLWFDVEQSIYTPPTLEWLNMAGRHCDSLGQRKGIYSSAEQWKALYGAAVLEGDWLGWAAGYNGVPDLNVPGFGGCEIVGHQFADKPVDQSVFAESVTR